MNHDGDDNGISNLIIIPIIIVIIVTIDIIILLLVLFVLIFVSLQWNRIVDTKVLKSGTDYWA